MDNTPDILIVEDDKFLKELALKKLKKEGFDVMAVSDGMTALKIVETKKPGLILLDILLPEMDGFEILQKMRANTKLKDVPIVLLSNLGQNTDRQKGMDLGANDYWIKAHFTLDEIVSKIKKYV